jgi:A/G-specific adenine glycosylase
VLVSETMLQQTTVAAVEPFYVRWMERFPTVQSLASADEDAVLALWQGLGYYRRARHLLACARRVAQDGWPDTEEQWLALPGIGKYTAGAVMSICFQRRVPAVDGNVERVYSRIAADASQQLKVSATEWASALVQCARPGDVNQALMDLGATVCRPKNPACHVCPLRRHCCAFASGTQSAFPSRKRGREVVSVRHDYVVPFCNGVIGVRRFGDDEWWSGMYGFARRNGERATTDLGTFTHTVTHHRVTAGAVLAMTDMDDSLLWKSVDELEQLPMPAPHRKILDRALNAIYESGWNATGTASVPSSAKK